MSESAFDDLFGGAGRPVLQEHQGRSATLIRSATDKGPEQRIALTHVMVNDVSDEIREKPDGSRVIEHVIEVRIGTDSSGEFGGAADVTFQDAFEIDGLVWAIERPLDHGSIDSFRCVRRSKIEMGRVGLRRT